MLLSAFYYTYDLLNMFRALFAHHQELTIIYHCSPHGTLASWDLMVVTCGSAGCVAGLAATAVALSSIWLVLHFIDYHNDARTNIRQITDFI
jgi:RsiW-degrading membrane proteinase PrsW (M82 family)